jgi:hypothetical protein
MPSHHYCTLSNSCQSKKLLANRILMDPSFFAEKSITILLLNSSPLPVINHRVEIEHTVEVEVVEYGVFH